MGNSRCAKRAWRRACRRACRFGHTYYRGSYLTRTQVIQQVQVSNSELMPEPEGTTSRPRSTANGVNGLNGSSRKHMDRQGRPMGQNSRQPGIKIFSWNVGGLGIGQLDSLLNYFCKEGIQVATLQETRWRNDCEWQSGPFLMIHSAGGTSDIYCGVLTCINVLLCPASLVRCSSTIPGRLLHVRLSHPNNSQHIDILNCYQHFLGRSDKASLVEQVEHKRQNFLHKLSGVLSGLPFRNHVLVMGDFNMNVEPLGNLVGSACGQFSPSWSPSADLMSMIETHDLCVLNTWSSPLSFSSSGPKGGRALVDYVMARRVQVSAASRCVSYMH